MGQFIDYYKFCRYIPLYRKLKKIHGSWSTNTRNRNGLEIARNAQKLPKTA